jgi:hypothetical protein
MQIKANSKFCEKKSGFVNSRLGVPSDEQDIYHQYFHFQLNLCRSCILPNILLKCRKAGCQLATTQWGEKKSEGVSFFVSCNILGFLSPIAIFVNAYLCYDNNTDVLGHSVPMF